MSLADAKDQVDLAFTREDLKGQGYENAFGGATSFLRRRYTKDLTGVDLAITGASKLGAESQEVRATRDP